MIPWKPQAKDALWTGGVAMLFFLEGGETQYGDL